MSNANEHGEKELESIDPKICEYRSTPIISHKYVNGQFQYFNGENWFLAADDDNNILRYWANMCHSPVPIIDDLTPIHCQKDSCENLFIFIKDNNGNVLVKSLKEVIFNNLKCLNQILAENIKTKL